MNKILLVSTLSTFLLNGINPAFSQEIEHFSQIERQASIRAKEYGNDIQQISKGLTPYNQSQEMTQYTTELRQRFERSESMSTHLKKVSHVVVFLSFSMPGKSLESWLLQCKISGATPVIRGLINNSFKETMSAIQELSKKVGIGMQLDPILFQTFGIKQVPAVVYAKHIPECPSNMDCKPIAFDVLYGDVSLNYALGKINEAQPVDDRRVTRMINRLEGSWK
ncbi:type-F conjugative transfer system pilin assembly protein TrbC [Legionella fallonii]|uniref:Putative conjugative transfer protein TrbC n=1 Tax=Legionella fallonii LLAP-10 TaxID=1212491 RepID=A0A098G9R6_9GAMM|nr:type-F conjugative transfer system pilin assembly protein TrbC [Legionella fallonii]CEG59224.1 Putative conjugative transfer protein TrbC [Legionella fallonii LLAP-10]